MQQFTQDCVYFVKGNILIRLIPQESQTSILFAFFHSYYICYGEITTFPSISSIVATLTLKPYDLSVWLIIHAIINNNTDPTFRENLIWKQ